jgi:hypothetical protein
MQLGWIHLAKRLQHLSQRALGHIGVTLKLDSSQRSSTMESSRSFKIWLR